MIALASIVITLIVCATVLAIADHPIAAIALGILALFVIADLEKAITEHQKSESGD